MHGPIEHLSYQSIRMQETLSPIFIEISDVARVLRGAHRRGTVRNVTLENIVAEDSHSSARKPAPSGEFVGCYEPGDAGRL